MAKSKPDLAAKTPPAPPAVMVVFGAWGDLTKRLLVPALYNLAKAGLLDDGFKIVGVDHNQVDDDHFRQGLEAFMRELDASVGGEAGEGAVDRSTWDWLDQRLFYQVGDFEDPASYRALAERIAELGGEGANVLFYLAVSPRFFGDIIAHLGQAGLMREPRGRFRRVVIEKPIGADVASARALNARILEVLDERQIYRIDHFQGKEAVRNIFVARFANAVFEPVWNHLYIDHVQITAAETVGVEDRGAYYDTSGALRDMIPNHLFQLLAMTAMEPPNALDPDAVRAEKTKVIKAISTMTPHQAQADSVRGQYHAGEVAGRRMTDYRHEPRVPRQSRTETYAALRLTIDNARWAGVPFYLRTGKAMAGHVTEVAVQFKPPPNPLFAQAAKLCPPNTLVLRVTPHPGVGLEVLAKRPGINSIPAPVDLDFRYEDAFDLPPSTGYESLVYDALIGDQTLYKTAEDIDYAWQAVQPVLDAWADGGAIHGYEAGSEGPAAADALLAREGRAWRPVGQ